MNINIWEVTAYAFDQQTGRRTSANKSEIINASEQVFFAACSSSLDIKAAYERLWNTAQATEHVKVWSVWPATKQQDDAPRPLLPATVRLLQDLPALPKGPKPSSQRRLERRAAARAGAADDWARSPAV